MTLPRRLTSIYWMCHFLRWMPLGLVMPVMVLLPVEQGLSLAKVGLLLAVYSALTAILDLPTGSLADTVGRKPLMITAIFLEIGWFVGFLKAHDLGAFMVAIAAGGIGRSLSSGALEAWYVDSIRATRPNENLRPAIGGAMFLTNVAVLLGALTTATLPGLTDTRGSTMAFAAAAVVSVIHLAAVMIFVRENRTTDGVRDVVRQMQTCPSLAMNILKLVMVQRDLRLLVTGGVAVGVAMGSVETFWQPHLATMLADGGKAATTFGVLYAVATLVGACGSLIAIRLRVARPAMACALLAILMGIAIATMASTATFAIAASGFVFLHLFLEIRAPLAQAMLHEAAPPGRRASALSAYSMSTNTGGFVASLGFGAFAQMWGVSPVWYLTAIVIGLASLVYIRLAKSHRRIDADEITRRPLSVPVMDQTNLRQKEPRL